MCDAEAHRGKTNEPLRLRRSHPWLGQKSKTSPKAVRSVPNAKLRLSCTDNQLAAKLAARSVAAVLWSGSTSPLCARASALRRWLEPTLHAVRAHTGDRAPEQDYYETNTNH
jgi:hypothetical protein